MVDTRIHGIRGTTGPDVPPVICWIGSPSISRDDTAPLAPMLAAIASEAGIRARVVGDGARARGVEGIEALARPEEEERPLIQSMDIGMLPYTATPRADGKSGSKLIQSMAHVVVFPAGVRVEIVEHGADGFLAETGAEWRAASETLLADRDLRAPLRTAGRREVDEHPSLRIRGPRVAEMLPDVAEAWRG